MSLYEEDIRCFLRSEYEKAKENGFQNIEVINDFMNGIPVDPKQFYSLCFALAKEEIKHPYIIQQIFERGTIIVVTIHFVHNI